MTIRPANTLDAKALVDLHFAAVHYTAAQSYPPEILTSWSPVPSDARYEAMGRVIAGGSEQVLVAEEDSGIAGFGSIEPASGELCAIYVHPSAGRRGVGSRLVAALEHLASSRGIPILHLSASVNAVRFYRRAGYETLGDDVVRLTSGQEMACVKMRKTLP